MYRQLTQEQRAQPLSEQWRYGEQLRVLKAAYIVNSEPQPGK